MTIRAKYAGTCTVCGKAIKVGDLIEWEKGKGSRHTHCKPVEIPKDAIKLHGSSGYGCHGWQAGQVVRQKQRDGHRYLYVLTASSRYVREDGMSFGVGDESGYLYSAVCRLATEAEARPLQEAAAKKAVQTAAATELKAIAESIRQKDNLPPAVAEAYVPAGDTIPVGKGQEIYGGGEWFVLGTEWIWFVKNNGADGDDWNYNNVRTGGAGAIGWRVPTTDDLANRIRQLAECMKG